MHTRVLLGLAVVVSAVAVGCTSERATAPVQSLAATPATWYEDEPPCGEIHPCEPPPVCDELHPCEPPCDELHPCEHVVNGRMTGGGGQLSVGDLYITRGFTIHCDITLSNNIEINWPGNKWHLDKPITSARCVDDPNISPVPPRAPFDTFFGEATGRLNGVDGSFLRFVFVDSGERGGENDMAMLQVFDPAGNLVLDLPLSALTNGNIQAHEDQPHKK